MTRIKTNKAKVKGYALLFNKDNMPKIRVHLKVPDNDWSELSSDQKQWANQRVTPELRRNN